MAQSDNWTPLRAAELGNLQLERQLRLLIEAVEAVWQEHDERILEMASPALEQRLRDRIETAKGYLA